MTSDLVGSREDEKRSGRHLSPEQAAAAAMVAEARARGLELTGPDGLLKLFTTNVLETALNEGMAEHLGHDKNRAEPGREATDVRNGRRSETVISGSVCWRRRRGGDQFAQAPLCERGTVAAVDHGVRLAVLSWYRTREGGLVQRNIRASDADREAVMRRLGRSFREGRLTLAEFDERVTALYAARSRAELDELTRDLPPDLW